MKLHATSYRYRLPLVRPLVVGNRTIEAREGVIVRFSDDEGHEALGEIAPLPGFSREKLADAIDQLQLILNEVNQSEWPVTALDRWENSDLLARFDSLYHSVSFGLSSALLQLVASRGGKRLHTMIDPISADRIYVNALLSGSDEEILEKVSRFAHQGYRAVKLKVGSRAVSDDVSLVYRVREALDPQISLRLDANRRWTFEQGIEFLSKIQDLKIEYIEEPLNNIRRLSELNDLNLAPIALDESLPEFFATGMQTRFLPKVVVLKPTLIGSWGRCLKIHDWAKEKGITTVISSSFESGVGLHSLAFLAAVISRDTPCGLDTSGWFAADLVRDGLPVHDGVCTLQDLHLTWSSINADLLSEASRG